jgi:hypothetical protein
MVTGGSAVAPCGVPVCASAPSIGAATVNKTADARIHSGDDASNARFTTDTVARDIIHPVPQTHVFPNTQCLGSLQHHNFAHHDLTHYLQRNVRSDIQRARDLDECKLDAHACMYRACDARRRYKLFYFQTANIGARI